MAIVVIDFDNTITDRETYPEIAKERNGAKRVINWLYEEGHCIIIATCRCDEAQEMAKEWLIEHGFKFCHINENCNVRINRYGNDTRKIGGHIFIDDKNIENMFYNGTKGVNWNELEISLKHILGTYELPHEKCKERLK